MVDVDGEIISCYCCWFIFLFFSGLVWFFLGGGRIVCEVEFVVEVGGGLCVCWCWK